MSVLAGKADSTKGLLKKLCFPDIRYEYGERFVYRFPSSCNEDAMPGAAAVTL